MENNILQVQDISIGYSHQNAPSVIANGINFSADCGELVALIGTNGIGKSTLLRTITSIQKPLSGKILIGGKNVQEFDPALLATKLSVVLTEKLPPGNLTVFELVALGRQPYTNWIGTLSQSDLLKINDALKATGTEHLAGRKSHEISDGQLQKVLIARALAQDTPLIILDEPTTHLDLEHKFTLFSLLKTLAHESGKCIIFSTHDIEMALQVCDKIIVMTKENVAVASPLDAIKSGKIDTMFSNPQIEFDREKVKFVFKDL